MDVTVSIAGCSAPWRAREAAAWTEWLARRAWRNAKQSRRLFRKSKRTAGLLFGAAAVSEVLGFVVFKGAGALFIVLGVGFAVLGYGMKDRT